MLDQALDKLTEIKQEVGEKKCKHTSPVSADIMYY